jgi:hypothetical protein
MPARAEQAVAFAGFALKLIGVTKIPRIRPFCRALNPAACPQALIPSK